MTKDEALRMALEALCVAVEPKKGKVYAREFEPIDCFAMHEQAITALREALAQPAQPEQEPVATKTEKGIILHVGWDDLPADTKLYTSPPKREWVGLTDDERAECWRSSAKQSAINIEAKLKEKNHE
jgi:hypothetical protein